MDSIEGENDYFVSRDRELIDYAAAAHLIIEVAAWGKAQHTGEDSVRSCIDNSAWCFGVYRKAANKTEMVGIARIISDKRTFGYLCDVVIHPEHRGCGLGKQLVRAIVADEEVVSLGTLLLITPDAHGLYRQFGFKSIDNPEMLMKR
ncbi:MAG: GNAT family N-acetyltransferase [Bacillota bacterium]